MSKQITVDLSEMPSHTKAKDTRHQCPVCQHGFFPRHTTKIPTSNNVVLLTQVTDSVCVKSLFEWDFTIVYYHDKRAEIMDFLTLDND